MWRPDPVNKNFSTEKKEKFFKHPGLPFVEARISIDSANLFKPHMHRRFSVGVALKGDIRYRIDDQNYILRPGSLALINPETLHSCNPTPGRTRTFSMLYLDSVWCLQVQQALWQVDRFMPVRHPIRHDGHLYRQYCQAIDLLMQKKHDLLARELLLVHLAEQIFATACDPRAPAENATPARLEHLKQLLGEQLDQDFTLARAAVELQVNPYTLLRQFRRRTGITPHAYRMNCRIEHARSLLQKGRTIADTALACGFFDQSHFHHHFKAMTTVTPKQYQRSLNFSLSGP